MALLSKHEFHRECSVARRSSQRMMPHLLRNSLDCAARALRATRNELTTHASSAARTTDKRCATA